MFLIPLLIAFFLNIEKGLNYKAPNLKNDFH